MFSAISLLVLACAVAINAQNACTQTHLGVVPTSLPVKLQPVVLPPGVADWRITIPTIPECQAVSGEQAFMCDTDLAPSGQFLDPNTLIVHRNGALQGYGTVLITVFCAPPVL